MPPTPRKSPAKTLAASPLAPVFEPIEIVSAPADEQVEMVTLFTLDGTAYDIPRKPRMNVALQLLTDVEEVGESMANMRLLRKLLGADGYDALANHDGLTSKQLGQVAQAASNFTLGSLEEDDTSGN